MDRFDEEAKAGQGGGDGARVRLGEEQAAGRSSVRA